MGWTAEPINAFELTNFYRLTRELRWEIICSINTNFDEQCVKKTNQKLEEHDEEKEKRITTLNQKHNVSVINKRLKFDEFLKVDVLKSSTEVNKAIDAVKGDVQTAISLLRDQIRVSKHVYAIPKKMLPLLTVIKNDDEAELQRLKGAMMEIVDNRLPPMKNVQPYPERDALPAPTQAAELIRAGYDKKVEEAYEKLRSLTNENITFVTVNTLQLASIRARLRVMMKSFEVQILLKTATVGKCSQSPTLRISKK